MSHKKFTDQEKKELLKNPNILKVGRCCVTYCSEFKIRAIREYQKGKFPFEIFIDAGINIDILGRNNPQKCLSRWKKTFNQQGEEGLKKESRGKYLPQKKMTIEEENKYLKAKNTLLEAEISFLKKLEQIERGMI